MIKESMQFLLPKSLRDFHGILEDIQEGCDTTVELVHKNGVALDKVKSSIPYHKQKDEV